MVKFERVAAFVRAELPSMPSYRGQAKHPTFLDRLLKTLIFVLTRHAARPEHDFPLARMSIEPMLGFPNKCIERMVQWLCKLGVLVRLNGQNPKKRYWNEVALSPNKYARPEWRPAGIYQFSGRVRAILEDDGIEAFVEVIDEPMIDVEPVIEDAPDVQEVGTEIALSTPPSLTDQNVTPNDSSERTNGSTILEDRSKGDLRSPKGILAAYRHLKDRHDLCRADANIVEASFRVLEGRPLPIDVEGMPPDHPGGPKAWRTHIRDLALAGLRHVAAVVAKRTGGG